jgi:N-acetylneuraminic acid mutarotase
MTNRAALTLALLAALTPLLLAQGAAGQTAGQCDPPASCQFLPLLLAEAPSAALPGPTATPTSSSPALPSPSAEPTPALDLQSTSWATATAEAPLRLFESQGMAVGGRLYVLGGYSGGTRVVTTTLAYDPADDTWQRLADLPAPLSHAGQASDGRYIFLAGGFSGDDPGPSVAQAWAYDTQADTWQVLPPLPAPRGGGGMALLGRDLHFFGGATREGGVWLADHADHWVLSLDGSPDWRPAAPLPNPRNHIGAVTLGGKIYAVGGQYLGFEGSGNQVSVDVYDPGSDTWSPAADLPLPLSHVASSSLALAGQLVVVGGVTQSALEVASVLAYDPAANSWSELAPLPAARQSPVAGLIGTRLYVATGERKNVAYATLYVGELRPITSIIGQAD